MLAVLWARARRLCGNGLGHHPRGPQHLLLCLAQAAKRALAQRGEDVRQGAGCGNDPGYLARGAVGQRVHARQRSLVAALHQHQGRYARVYPVHVAAPEAARHPQGQCNTAGARRGHVRDETEGVRDYGAGQVPSSASTAADGCARSHTYRASSSDVDLPSSAAAAEVAVAVAVAYVAALLASRNTPSASSSPGCGSITLNDDAADVGEKMRAKRTRSGVNLGDSEPQQREGVGVGG